MFNLGPGEVTVLLLLALIFLGPQKLPDLAQLLGQRRQEVRWNARTPRPRAREPWSRARWLLIGAALALGTFALAVALTRAR